LQNSYIFKQFISYLVNAENSLGQCCYKLEVKIQKFRFCSLLHQILKQTLQNLRLKMIKNP